MLMLYWRVIILGDMLRLIHSAYETNHQPDTGSLPAMDKPWFWDEYGMYLPLNQQNQYQVVPGTCLSGSFEKRTWFIGIHVELERNELKWNEMKWMKCMNWHESSDMNDLKLKRMNWTEWIKRNELNWKNGNEGNEMEELKWRSWDDGIEVKDVNIETNRSKWMNWNERIVMNDVRCRNWNEAIDIK